LRRVLLQILTQFGRPDLDQIESRVTGRAKVSFEICVWPIAIALSDPILY